ncbi:MAG: hypothetical protein R3Y26_10120 [Rikenellaceae bacterium]
MKSHKHYKILKEHALPLFSLLLIFGSCTKEDKYIINTNIDIMVARTYYCESTTNENQIVNHLSQLLTYNL